MTAKILGIAGSLRRESLNRRLLDTARHHLPAGVELHGWGGLAALPHFDEDLESGPVPPAVAELRRAIADADALLIATPEYNGSVPGALKNAIDWASRPRGAAVLAGKPTAVIGASPTPHGAAWAQSELRKVLSIAGANVIDAQLEVPHVFRQFDENHRLLDHELRGRLTEVLTALTALVDADATAA